jgi:hypothetical protein
MVGGVPGSIAGGHREEFASFRPREEKTAEEMRKQAFPHCHRAAHLYGRPNIRRRFVLNH